MLKIFSPEMSTSYGLLTTTGRIRKEGSSMSWQRYYQTWPHTRVYPAGLARDPEVVGWSIVYNDDHEYPLALAYNKLYRTEKHAIRGAERLYKREIGHLETAFELTE
jgi:hypothetical protein